MYTPSTMSTADPDTRSARRASPAARARRAPAGPRRGAAEAAPRRGRGLDRALPPPYRYPQGVRGHRLEGPWSPRGADLRTRDAAGCRDRAARAGGRRARGQPGDARPPRLHPGRRPVSRGAGRFPGRGHQQVRGRLLRRPRRGADGEPAGPVGGRSGRVSRCSRRATSRPAAASPPWPPSWRRARRMAWPARRWRVPSST